MSQFKKNTASQFAPPAVLIHSTTGAALTTGATVAVSKDGGTVATGAGTLTYLSHATGGHWTYQPTQAETDCDQLVVVYNHGDAANPFITTVYTTTITISELESLVNNIKSQTDQFAFTVANQVDANAITSSGTGLSQQEVRDAVGMESANLDSQLASLVVSGVSSSLPVSPSDGHISVTRGDDYYAQESRQLQWTEDSLGVWPDLTGATIELTYEQSSTFTNSVYYPVDIPNDGAVPPTKVKKTIAGVVTTLLGKQVLTFELSSDDTDVPVGSYNYDIQVHLQSSNNTITLIIGTMTVLQDYNLT